MEVQVSRLAIGVEHEMGPRSARKEWPWPSEIGAPRGTHGLIRHFIRRPTSRGIGPNTSVWPPGEAPMPPQSRTGLDECNVIRYTSQCDIALLP
jgi:hypothetical protein